MLVSQKLASATKQVFVFFFSESMCSIHLPPHIASPYHTLPEQGLNHLSALKTCLSKTIQISVQIGSGMSLVAFIGLDSRC